MYNRPSRRRPGFTLVELMTVIAIIVLLIGVLIPTLSSARKQAKAARTKGLLKALESGCEMFHTDLHRYPQSHGENPFEDEEIPLMGAQWLALQLLGADSRGFVEPALKNDSGEDPGDRDGEIDEEDWLDWYSLDPTREYARQGPYAEADPENLRTTEQVIFTYNDAQAIRYIPEYLVGSTVDPPGSGGETQWNNGRLVWFVDAFDYPVLYYRANQKVEQPFTTGVRGDKDFTVGRYDHSDNVYFTGGEGGNGFFDISTPGWDFSASAANPGGFKHPLGYFGYDRDDPTTWPSPPPPPAKGMRFAEVVCDENLYETTLTTGGGRLWPHNPDTYLLISPGDDGLYGSNDDITNFVQ